MNEKDKQTQLMYKLGKEEKPVSFMCKVSFENIKKGWLKMKKYIGSILAVIMLLMLVSCATWKSNTTTGYEATGTTLTEVRNAAKPLCDSGTISDLDCIRIKNVYTKARDAYIVAGNALILAMNTEDAVIKEKSLESYHKAMRDIAELIPQLINLASELGIKAGI